MADLPVLQQLTVEIRYSSGFLYYDRSGAALRGLLSVLGSPPFSAGTPEASPVLVASGLSSPADRINVDYNAERFTVRQFGLETIARAEQVAPSAWEVVSDKLEVKKSVTRLGVRFVLMWPTESSDSAEQRLLSTGLVSETERWKQLLGTPTKRAYTAVTGSKGSDQARFVLSGGSSVIEGEVPASLKKFHMPAGIVLDIHCYREFDAAAGSLPKQMLKDFIRDSWNQSKDVAQKIAGLL